MDIPCTYIPDGMFKMPVRLLVGRNRCTLHSLAIYDRRGIQVNMMAVLVYQMVLIFITGSAKIVETS